MPPHAACEERYRLAGEEVCRATGEGADDLPSELVSLLDRSERDPHRIWHPPLAVVNVTLETEDVCA